MKLQIAWLPDLEFCNTCATPRWPDTAHLGEYLGSVADGGGYGY